MAWIYNHVDLILLFCLSFWFTIMFLRHRRQMAKRQAQIDKEWTAIEDTLWSDIKKKRESAK